MQEVINKVRGVKGDIDAIISAEDKDTGNRCTFRAGKTLNFYGENYSWHDAYRRFFSMAKDFLGIAKSSNIKLVIVPFSDKTEEETQAWARRISINELRKTRAHEAEGFDWL